MGRRWVCGVAALTMGCALAYPPNDPKSYHPRPHPTREQLEALMATPVPDRGGRIAETTFELRVYPPFAFEGGAARLTCIVPEAFGIGTIRLELAGVRAFEEQIQRIETGILIEHLPCGTLTARCSIRQAQTGRIDRRERSLIVKGRCNEDGD